MGTLGHAIKRRVREALGPVLRRLHTRAISNPYLSAKFVPDHRGRAESVFTDGDDGAVPPVHLLHGYSVEEYTEGSKRDVAAMLDMVRGHGGNPDSLRRVLEFGCATGRLLRAMPDRLDGERWGVDISAPHIRWCQQHLTPPMRFATITTNPHLPFEDNTFDLAFAGSMFTHIDDLAEAWLLELRRVLAPGGYVYATVHDEHTLDLLLTRYRHDPGHQALVEPLVEFLDRTGTAKRPYRQFAFGVDPESQVFHRLDALLERWGLLMEPIATQREASGYQTGVLLRKRT